jgi:S-adenosylmethionine/arginine decarboxylase-like enzyme
MAIIASAGTHVTIDAFVADPATFKAKSIEKLLHLLVDALGMTILQGPDVIDVPVDPKILERAQETGVFEDEGGTTAFCVISKSHISIHCWPLQKFFSADVFSCCDYEPLIALEIIREHMGVLREDVHVLRRRKPLA